MLYLHRLSDGSRIKELPLDIGSVVGFSGKKKTNRSELNRKKIRILSADLFLKCLL